METAVDYLPLYVFPPIEFVSAMINSEKPVVSIGERFEKQTFRSRFEIAGPNGRQMLSIPLDHKSTHASTSEVIIDQKNNWQVKHWRSIETAYRKAPFFEFYAHYFEPQFTRKYYLLSEMSLECLHIV